MKRLTQEQFVEKAGLVHNNFYDYSNAIYIGYGKPIRIACPTHGYFEQLAVNHIKGSGCSECRNELLRVARIKPLSQFVEEASKIHNNLYDYSKVEYHGAIEKIHIICSIHGEFKQKPDHHLNGHGCPQCYHRISRSEIKWLDSLNVLEEFRQYNIVIGKYRYNVDGYDPITNNVYEFLGDFWHGNPKRFESSEIHPLIGKSYGELYNNTLIRKDAFVSAGYNTFFIWENDFKKGNINAYL